MSSSVHSWLAAMMAVLGLSAFGALGGGFHEQVVGHSTGSAIGKNLEDTSSVTGVPSLTTRHLAVGTGILRGTRFGHNAVGRSVGSTPTQTRGRLVEPTTPDIEWTTRENPLTGEVYHVPANFDPDIPRHAFGDPNNAIELSWELEGTNMAIVNYYRPSDVSDEMWDGLTPLQRILYTKYRFGSEGDAESPLFAQLPEAFRSMDRLDREGFYWDKEASEYGEPVWMRRGSAPPWMREKLDDEYAGKVWETTHASANETLGQQTDQLALLRETLRENGFHTHTTFRIDQAYVDFIAGLLEYLDTVQTMRLFRQPGNISHPYLGPRYGDQVDRVAKNLKVWEVFDSEKEYSEGLRQRIYHKRQDEYARIGLETRANGDDPVFSETLQERIVMALVDPKGTNLRLSARGGPDFTVADLQNVRRKKGQPTIDRYASNTIARILDTDAGRGEDGVGRGVDTFHRLSEIDSYVAYTTDKGIKLPLGIERWGYPLVRWEERIQYAHLQTEIEQARRVYEEKLVQIGDDWAKLGDRRKSTAKQFERRIQEALSAFINDAGLAEAI